MPYIAPNTKLYILKGVPLDNTYEHTVAYPDSNTQLTEFLKYKKFELEKLSYQRVGAGLMRVELTYEQMYDCNYMIFQNTSYGNKWWYAFITGVAYVNNTVCTISYEIDVMQTWCFDYTFLPTFVERKHISPNLDKPENLANHYWQPEGLETGAEPTVIWSSRIAGELQSIVLVATEKNDGTKVSFGMLNGYYTPLHVSVYDCGKDLSNVPQAFYDEMNGYRNNGKVESIISLGAGPGTVNGQFSVVDDYNFNPDSGLYTNESITYHPKNAKLFLYPFHFYRISDQNGNYQILRPEWFSDYKKIKFLTVCYTYPTPTATIVPINYNSERLITDDNELTDEEIYKVIRNGLPYSLTLTDYPNYIIDNDSYKAWWAQNRNSYLASLGNVTRSYNAEMANIGNSYAQQMISLRNSYGNNILQANTAYGNSMRSNQTSLENSMADSRLQLASGGVNAVVGGIGAIMGGSGGDIVGAFASGVNSMMASSVTADNAERTANTNYAIAQANLRNAANIGSNNFNSGKQIAELAKQASSLSALTNSQNATASLVAKKEDMKNCPDGYVGSIAGSVVKADCEAYGFVFQELVVRYAFLKMADDYFEKYGYKIAMIETPSKMNNRMYWCYLQTVGCNIKGNFNDTDISTIKSIYNNGITTWDALEHVGNYNLDNHTIKPITTADNEGK